MGAGARIGGALMPPLACGVGSGAPWRSLPVAASPIPPPPDLADVVAIWQWGELVIEAAGIVSSWESVYHQAGGPYVLASLGASVSVGATGLVFGASSYMQAPIGAIPGLTGPALGAAFALDAAHLATLPTQYAVLLFDSALPPGYDYARLQYFAGLPTDNAPALQVRAGGFVNDYIAISGGPPLLREGAAMVGAQQTQMRARSIDPAAGAVGWNSSPPLGLPFVAPAWTARVGNSSSGLVGAVRAVGIWRTNGTDAQQQARADYLQAIGAL